MLHRLVFEFSLQTSLKMFKFTSSFHIYELVLQLQCDGEPKTTQNRGLPELPSLTVPTRYLHTYCEKQTRNLRASRVIYKEII